MPLSPGQYENPADIKAGVVGYGGAFNMGKSHLKGMEAAGMTPAAVCEIDPERLEVATEDFPGIGTYGSLEEMLADSDVDVITIITPHNTHADLAIQCLEAGRHVVTEKPFAITTDECDAMIAAAEKADVMLSTYHNRHWDGCVLTALQKVVKEKVIGDIVRIQARMGNYGQPGDWWRTSKSISGGILYDWGVHLLEYGLQLIDAPIAEVSGYAHQGHWADKTRWKDDTNEDEGFLVTRFETGQWMTLRITTVDAWPKEKDFEITGTKGTFAFDQGRWELRLPQEEGLLIQKGRNQPGEQLKYYQNVADHLVDGTDLVITPEWARRPIHILDLANRSVEEGVSQKPRYT